MSYEAMHKVRASGLSDRTQVDVLEALAFFLNKETGACFPSTEAISRISRVNDRLVRTTLKTLHSLGLISSTQKAGQKRYFTLHLDRLPLPTPLQEVTGGQENAGGEESTPLYENTPLQESTGEGCRKIQGTPVGKCSTPLYETTPEQGINKESNKEGNKEDSAPAEGDTFNPSEWALKQSPKNGTHESTENGTTQKGDIPKTEQRSSQKRDDGSTENGTTVVPKTGHEPINEPINNQSITSREDAPPKARAKKGEAWKKWIKVEKPAEVPDDLWKQFGEIRALKKMALTERAFDLLRSEGEKAHMTLLQVVETCCGNGWAGFKASWLARTSGSTYRKPQNVTQTAEYRERLQACCRGEGRTEKLADDGVTIIVD